MPAVVVTLSCPASRSELELAVTIEPVPEAHVTDEIMDGAEAVEAANWFVPEQRVLTIAVDPSRDHG